MRILVTGSRDWVDHYAVEFLLDNVLSGQWSSSHLTLVHGGCPTGADAFASEWCDAHPEVTEEVWRADWKEFGRAAGPIRNREMATSGFDVCLAFILNESKGASGALEWAKRYQKFHRNSKIICISEWS